VGRSGLLTFAGNLTNSPTALSINGQSATVYHDLTFAVTNGLALNNGLNEFTAVISSGLTMTNVFPQMLPAAVNLVYDTTKSKKVNTVKDLHIEFNPTQRLLTPETGSKKLLFGRIRLFINSDSNEEIQDILHIQADLNELAEWFGNNRDALLDEILPIGDFGFSSIAEAIGHYYEDSEPKFNELMDERLYNYRLSHGLRFGMRGVDIPDIYLGIFGEHHEISFIGEKVKWKYEINLLAFLDEVQEKLNAKHQS
jgi:hypothetical protein